VQQGWAGLVEINESDVEMWNGNSFQQKRRSQ